MCFLTRNCFIRGFIFQVRLVSTEVEKGSESKKTNHLQKAEPPAKEPIFYQNKAQVDAEIKGNKFSFKYQTTAKMNYDFWHYLVDFVEMTSHKKLREAKTNAADLADQLQIARNAKTRIEVELEEFRRSFMLHRFQEQELMPKNYESVILTRENDLQITESRLSASFREALETEQNIYNAFMEAINDSYKKEELHSRFLRASIIIGIIATFILTVIASYIYHLNLHQEVNRRADKKKEQNESWGSYMKGYVNPLYSWAIPKK